MEEYASSGPVKEKMRRVYELVGKLQSHINGGSPEMELAGLLCHEVLQCCDAALSQLKEHSTSPSPDSTSPSSSPPSKASFPCSSFRRSTPPVSTTGGQGRKRARELDEKLTISPFEEGRHWRKYGEKKIAGTDFTRRYYRCSYKEEKKCQAKMRVQQLDEQNPPMFLVTHDKEHTCNVQSLFNAPNKLKSDSQFQSFENKQAKSSNLSFIAQLGCAGEISSRSSDHLIQCDSTPSLNQEGLSSSCSLNTMNSGYFDTTTSTPLEFRWFSDEEIRQLLEEL